MLQIELVPITAIRPYENNAKIHTEEQIQQIKKSIVEFGNNDPIAIDANGVIIEGHGRLMALQELGYTEVEVIRLGHLTEEQRKAYTLIHNKLTMNTGFDLDILATELQAIETINMKDYDFDLDIADDVCVEDIEEDNFDPEIPEEATAKRGQVYQLGDHRLMCGDSTSPADVQKLMRDEQADCLLTDPPFSKMKKEELVSLLQSVYSSATTVIDEMKPSKSDLHPTMKPLRLMAYLIQNSTKKGEIVLDLFGGSGSTLIAAEETKRRCRMMEYDPRYVDVIIQRWEEQTGKKARLLTE